MRRFVYAPDVNAYILTDSGMIDVSADIINGSVTRRINAASNASITLQNPNRKYLRKQTPQGQKLQESGDLLFKPMDRIVIYLTRVKSIPVFSGYIDRAPYDQLYPGPVTITATCTLKRLMNTYWDPGLVFVQQWMAKYGWVWNPLDGTVVDSKQRSLFNSDFSGGLGFMLHQILNEVGGWPAGEGNKPNTIHILELPDEFLSKTATILATQQAESDQQEQDIAELVKTLITPQGIISDLNPDGQNTLTAKSSYTNTNPVPQSAAKDYPAKIFGEAITPGGTGVAGQIAAAFEAKGIPARLGVATALAESGLRTNAASRVVNPQGRAAGVFQYYLKTVPHQADADAARAYATAHYDGNGSAPGLEKVYPVSEQIEDAAAWFVAAKPGPVNPSNVNDMARWCERAQVAGTYFVNGAATNYFKENWDKAGSLLGQQASGPKQGVIGDVHTNVSSLFDSKKNGYTFVAKSNPFGDDRLIFKAKYDPNTPSGMVSFYVPGADNKAPPWASVWTNHNVTVSAPDDQTSTAAASTSTTDTTSGATGGSIADKIVKIAQGQIGIKEIDSTNTGPQVDAYLAYTNTAKGQPWCAAFVSWVYGKAGVSTVKTASAAALEGTGKNTNTPSPGMIATFRTNDGTPDNDHAGIVVRVSGNQFWTIEGNHSNGVGPGGPYDVSSASVKVTAVPGIGVAEGDTTGTLDGTGAGLDIADFTSSTAAGFALGFPAVADVMESQLLSGNRAMANDVPLFEWIEFIVKASGRNFMSTPSGDFIAFYPDYFNWTGEAPYFTISGIETINLTIDIGDDELTTHVFTTGDTLPGTAAGSPGELIEKLHSTVASVEQIDVFQTLVNAPNFDVGKFLSRYGARPHSEYRPEIKHALLQFMYGWMIFLERWAKQFYCEAQFTFMPELIPGGLVDFLDHDLIMYIQEVTHTFDRASGFTTTASLIAPSTRGGSNPSMVLVGGPADTTATTNAQAPLASSGSSGGVNQGI